MKHLKIHELPFKSVIVLAIECKIYLKNFTALGAFQNSRALCREENKVEFREGRFHAKKLPFLHKKIAEHHFELSLSTFYLLTVYF